MPVEALNAVPALARRSAQRGLEAIQAAVAAKAVHKVAAVADISFLGPWTERSLRRRISTESRSWHFCCPRPSAHAALHVRARASHLLRGLCAPTAAAAGTYGEDGPAPSLRPFSGGCSCGREHWVYG